MLGTRPKTNPKKKAKKRAKKRAKKKSLTAKAKRAAKTKTGRAGIGAGAGALLLGPVGAVGGALYGASTAKGNPRPNVSSFEPGPGVHVVIEREEEEPVKMRRPPSPGHRLARVKLRPSEVALDETKLVDNPTLGQRGRMIAKVLHGQKRPMSTNRIGHETGLTDIEVASGLNWLRNHGWVQKSGEGYKLMKNPSVERDIATLRGRKVRSSAVAGAKHEKTAGRLRGAQVRRILASNPLAPGPESSVIHGNIKELIHSGVPQRQAVAAAYEHARSTSPAGMVPPAPNPLELPTLRRLKTFQLKRLGQYTVVDLGKRPNWKSPSIFIDDRQTIYVMLDADPDEAGWVHPSLGLVDLVAIGGTGEIRWTVTVDNDFGKGLNAAEHFKLVPTGVKVTAKIPRLSDWQRLLERRRAQHEKLMARERTRRGKRISEASRRREKKNPGSHAPQIDAKTLRLVKSYCEKKIAFLDAFGGAKPDAEKKAEQAGKALGKVIEHLKDMGVDEGEGALLTTTACELAVDLRALARKYGVSDANIKKMVKQAEEELQESSTKNPGSYAPERGTTNIGFLLSEASHKDGFGDVGVFPEEISALYRGKLIKKGRAYTTEFGEKVQVYHATAKGKKVLADQYSDAPAPHGNPHKKNARPIRGTGLAKHHEAGTSMAQSIDPTGSYSEGYVVRPDEIARGSVGEHGIGVLAVRVGRRWANVHPLRDAGLKDFSPEVYGVRWWMRPSEVQELKDAEDFKSIKGNPKKKAKKKAKKKTARKATPEWQRLINRCQKLWDSYCERPGKKRLRLVLAHCEKMKRSTSAKVRVERSRCARAAKAEAKKLKMKL